jgi:hypothetical protein
MALASEDEDGLGEGADAAWAAAETVEYVPVLEDRESSFAL